MGNKGLKKEVERIISQPDNIQESKLKALYKHADTNKDGVLDMKEFSQIMQIVYEVEIEKLRDEMHHLFHKGFWEKISEKEYHFDSQFASEAAVKSHAEKFSREADANSDGQITLDECVAWFMKHLKIPLSERIGWEFSPTDTWHTCCKPPRLEKLSNKEFYKMGIFLYDLLSERIFLLRNIPEIGPILGVKDLYHYLLSFLFEVLEITNASYSYSYAHHGYFTAYELLNNLTYPDVASKARLGELLSLGIGPKSRLNYLGNNLHGMIFIPEVNADEKKRAEELFAEAVPILKERCDAATASHNEYQILGQLTICGWGVPQNNDAGILLLQSAVKAHSGAAMYNMGTILMRIFASLAQQAMSTLNFQKFKEAHKIMMGSLKYFDACSGLNALGQVVLYEQKLKGISEDWKVETESDMNALKPNPTGAYPHLIKGLAKECPMAYHYIGMGMLTGDEVFNKNKELGVTWIHRAACHKSPQGHMELMKHGYSGSGAMPAEMVPKLYIHKWADIVDYLRRK